MGRSWKKETSFPSLLHYYVRWPALVRPAHGPVGSGLYGSVECVLRAVCKRRLGPGRRARVRQRLRRQSRVNSLLRRAAPGVGPITKFSNRSILSVIRVERRPGFVVPRRFFEDAHARGNRRRRGLENRVHGRVWRRTGDFDAGQDVGDTGTTAGTAGTVLRRRR